MPTSTAGSPRAARPSRCSRTTSAAERLYAAILTTAAPVARIARYRDSRSAGVASKSCVDSTTLRPPPRRDHIVEPGAPFQVHPVGPKLQRAQQDAPPLLLGPREPAALPDRPAGDHDRAGPTGEGTVDIGVGHAVEPQLDEVGAVRRVPRRPQAGHGTGRHGGAESSPGHRKSSHKKSPSNRGPERLSRSAVAVVRRADAPLRAG